MNMNLTIDKNAYVVIASRIPGSLIRNSVGSPNCVQILPAAVSASITSVIHVNVRLTGPRLSCQDEQNINV